jgi:hypothetical protein
VREPAPGVAGNEAGPPSEPKEREQPAITEVADGEANDRPRRRGWWSRRMAGG